MEENKNESVIKTNKSFNDFMLLTYFGITKKNNLDEVSDKCAERAYQDLARTVDYTKSSKELEKMGKAEADTYNGKKEEFIKTINKDIVSAIEGMPNPNEYVIDTYRTAFDEWHKSTCETIVDVETDIIEGNRLTYGQAQKWLNMTLKYMCFFPDLFHLANNKIEGALHVPVDHLILKEAWEEENKDKTYSERVIKFPLNPKYQKNDKKSGAFSDGKDGKVVAWSDWNDYAQYLVFQLALRDWCNEDLQNRGYPIQWEAKAWMSAKLKEDEKEANRKKRKNRKN